MNQKISFLLLTALILILGQSCFTGKDKDIPDVSNIKVEVDIKDFNQQLFNIDTNDIPTGMNQLKEKFPFFFEIYFSQVLLILKNSELDEEFYQNVKSFLTDVDIRRLADTTAIVYPNYNKIEKEFEQAFKFYKYHFPNKSIPQIYPIISGFNYAAFIFPIDEDQDGIGIGLDMLLGREYPYWQLGLQNPAFSNYITRSFTPEHLVKKSLDALLNDLIEIPSGDRLIDYMMYNGKKLYLLDQLLPYTDDSIKWEYTTQQTEWVKNNETQMWSHFLKEQLLYETSVNKTKKLVDQSPSSPGMPPEAPGRTGNYMGLKIIEAFMDKNPETSMEELIPMDPQVIMDKSKYKPRLRR